MVLMRFMGRFVSRLFGAGRGDSVVDIAVAAGLDRGQEQAARNRGLRLRLPRGWKTRTRVDKTYIS